MSQKIYVISDTHFGQWFANWFFNRPFKNVKDMNEQLIKNWNEVVNDEDLIIIVGDFYAGNRIFLRQLVESLNGEKILVKGNHDFKYRYRKLIEDSKIEVYNRLEVMYKGKKLLFTHVAEDVCSDTINIHGHYHRKLLPSGFSGTYYNVCVEHNDYKPVAIDKILSSALKVSPNEISNLELFYLLKKRHLWNTSIVL